MWAIAAQHAAEVHQRDYFNEKHVNMSLRMWYPALFLGFAPNMSHGYFVMNAEGEVDIISNMQAEAQLKDNNQHFDEIEPEQPKQEETLAPFHLFPPGKEQHVYSCPAGRGKPGEHTKDDICRLTAMDLREDVIAYIEDAEQSCLHQMQPVDRLLRYADEFVHFGPTDIRACLEEEISQIWKKNQSATSNNW